MKDNLKNYEEEINRLNTIIKKTPNIDIKKEIGKELLSLKTDLKNGVILK